IQSQPGGDNMAKMTVDELDEHRSRNRMKVRQPRALTVVPPTVVSQVTSSVISETTPAAPTCIFAAPPSVTQRAPIENESAVTADRLQRLWRWLFAAPIAPTATDLVQLRRDIKEWIKLQHKIDKLDVRW